MARLVLVINSANESIEQLNGKVMDRGGAHEAVQALKNFLAGALSGAGHDLTVEITTRDTDVIVATSGANSKQETHNI